MKHWHEYTAAEIAVLDGPQLDAAVAEAMGWKPPKMTEKQYRFRWPSPFRDAGFHRAKHCWWKPPRCKGYEEDPPAAHSDLNAAAKFGEFVCGQVPEASFKVSYVWDRNPRWMCRMMAPGPAAYGWAAIEATARCRAGLLALLAAREDPRHG